MYSCTHCTAPGTYKEPNVQWMIGFLLPVFSMLMVCLCYLHSTIKRWTSFILNYQIKNSFPHLLLHLVFTEGWVKWSRSIMSDSLRPRRAVRASSSYEDRTGKSGSFGLWHHPRGYVSNFLLRPASSLGALERSGTPSRHSRGINTPVAITRAEGAQMKWFREPRCSFRVRPVCRGILRLHQGCQVPFRTSRQKVGLLLSRCSGQGPHPWKALKNPSASAGDTGSIPDPGRSHKPWATKSMCHK